MTPTISSSLPDLSLSEDELLSPMLEPKTKSRYSITINRPIDEVFIFISNLRNLTDVLVSAELRVHDHSRLEIDLKVERANERISFRSTEKSDVEVHGEIGLAHAPADRGTVIALEADYTLPGGKLQEWLGLFSGQDLDTVMQIQLKRLKSFLETGEIPTTAGQPSGRDEEQPGTTVH